MLNSNMCSHILYLLSFTSGNEITHFTSQFHSFLPSYLYTITDWVTHIVVLDVVLHAEFKSVLAYSASIIIYKRGWDYSFYKSNLLVLLSYLYTISDRVTHIVFLYVVLHAEFKSEVAYSVCFIICKRLGKNSFYKYLYIFRVGNTGKLLIFEWRI
jgi:hypothetical protein